MTRPGRFVFAPRNVVIHLEGWGTAGAFASRASRCPGVHIRAWLPLRPRRAKREYDRIHTEESG